MTPATERVLARPLPVLAAPMAGVSTPALAAAVSGAGGLGFLAAGLLDAGAMAAEIAAYRSLGGAPVAVNLFTPQVDRTDELAADLSRYAGELSPTAARHRTVPGDPVFDRDDFDAKIERLLAEPVDAITLTFGPVPAEVVTALQSVGTAVGFTVTDPNEAAQAATLGADLLVAQGCEAGGHRGTWRLEDEPNRMGTAAVVAEVATLGLPVVAAGGVAAPADVAQLLGAGAVAVAVGTLYAACPQARTSAVHREALRDPARELARVTRAFTGRPARSLVNDFVRDLDGRAPAAYPQVHHMTRGIRAASAAHGDPEAVALWAGAGHRALWPGAEVPVPHEAGDLTRFLAGN